MSVKDTKFPAWALLAREVCLLQPSSAAAERVFSIFRRTFDKGQQSTLDDHVETALMLQYIRLKAPVRLSSRREAGVPAVSRAG